jgi:hypothetical protein
MPDAGTVLRWVRICMHSYLIQNTKKFKPLIKKILKCKIKILMFVNSILPVTATPNNNRFALPGKIVLPVLFKL